MQVSEYFRKFIVYYVEDAVFIGEQTARRKYLQRYSVIEGCEYDALQENLSFLIDVLNEYKEKKSEVSLKMVKYLTKSCFLPDSFIENFQEKLSSWEKSLATYSSYMKERCGDIFNEMPGGKMLKPKAKQKKTDVMHDSIIAVDLGLPSGTKWGNMNIGAATPEELGNCYAWGETEEKDVFNDVTYQHSTGVDNDGDGWYEEDEDYDDIGENICGTRFDVAHVKLGENWQMPTLDQFQELADKCRCEWTTINGFGGWNLTGPNGNTIFFPDASYWSGIHDELQTDCAISFRFFSEGESDESFDSRFEGNPVRPIFK